MLILDIQLTHPFLDDMPFLVNLLKDFDEPNRNKPRRLAKQGAARWQPLRYSSLSSNILASRVFFCTAMAENILRQNAMA